MEISQTTGNQGFQPVSGQTTLVDLLKEFNKGNIAPANISREMFQTLQISSQTGALGEHTFRALDGDALVFIDKAQFDNLEPQDRDAVLDLHIGGNHVHVVSKQALAQHRDAALNPPETVPFAGLLPSLAPTDIDEMRDSLDEIDENSTDDDVEAYIEHQSTKLKSNEKFSETISHRGVSAEQFVRRAVLAKKINSYFKNNFRSADSNRSRTTAEKREEIKQDKIEDQNRRLNQEKKGATKKDSKEVQAQHRTETLERKEDEYGEGGMYGKDAPLTEDNT